MFFGSSGSHKSTGMSYIAGRELREITIDVQRESGLRRWELRNML